MVLLLSTVIIMGIAIFCFIKGYIAAGIAAVVGIPVGHIWLDRIRWPALIFSGTFLVVRGYPIGLLLATPIVWDIFGLKLLELREKNAGWKGLVMQAYEYARRGKYKETIRVAKKALEINPLVSEAWRLIGNADELIGDKLEIESGSFEADLYHLEATNAWNKAKEIDPKIRIPGYHDDRKLRDKYGNKADSSFESLRKDYFEHLEED